MRSPASWRLGYTASSSSNPTNGDSSSSSNGMATENPDLTRHTTSTKRSRPPSSRPLRKQGGRRSPARLSSFLPGLARGTRGRGKAFVKRREGEKSTSRTKEPATRRWLAAAGRPRSRRHGPQVPFAPPLGALRPLVRRVQPVREHRSFVPGPDGAYEPTSRARIRPSAFGEASAARGGCVMPSRAGSQARRACVPAPSRPLGRLPSATIA
jgi:hypothetical protein